MDARYHLIDGPRPELYDVVRDPAETRDILSEKPQVASAMRTALAERHLRLQAARARDARRSASGSRASATWRAARPSPDTASALPNPRDRIASYVAARAAFGLVEQGKDQEAVRAFDRVLAENPAFVDALTERAAALGRLGRYRESVAGYRKAIEKSPELAVPLSLTVARVQLEMGDLARGPRDRAEKAIGVESDAAHELLASVALAAASLDEAEREAALVASDPGALARAAVVRAEVAARRGHPEQALERLDGVRAGEREPRPGPLARVRAGRRARPPRASRGGGGRPARGDRGLPATTPAPTRASPSCGRCAALRSPRAGACSSR